MRTDIVMRITIWLVENLIDGPAGEAFAGDLLETFANGRSRWWCFGQALWRAASLTELRLRVLLLPLWYSIAFVLLHPLWQWSCASSVKTLESYRNVLAWPGSAVLEVLAGLLPAVCFVWIGVFAFVLLRWQVLRHINLIQIPLSLSFGCCMISAETVLRLNDAHHDLRMLSSTDFYYPVSHARFSALLFFALFTSIALLGPGSGTIHRRRSLRLLTRGSVVRAVRSLGILAVLAPQVSAQVMTPQGAPAKQLVRLIALFDGDDWSAFHAAYIASFVTSPPDVPLGREIFRQRTGGVDLRKVEGDTPTQAIMLVQEHNSDQFARITLEVEPDEPHRIVQLRMGPIERPSEFPYESLSDADVITQARTRIHALADRGQFAGVVLLQHDGHTAYSEAFGEADRTRHVANTMDTRFRIGSMNKMFTAVATLQLVAAGKLQLDAPIGRYLTDYPNKDAAAHVTIRHLLSHSGGTGDFFGAEFEAHRQTLRTHEDFVTLFGPRALRFEPGTRFEYSNYGFLILGAIIDRVSGQSYYQYVQDHVYAPAGMTSTGSEPEEVAVPGRAIGYTRAAGDGWQVNDAYLPYRGASAGGGYTTAGDLLLFAEALQGHKLLSVANTQLVLTPTDIPGGGDLYGFGFQIDREPSGLCFGHSGGSPGQAATLEICPRAGYTMVWLSNTDPPGALLPTQYVMHRLPSR
jgi:CubicO group peptidase (beta-lactamase class C family)